MVIDDSVWYNWVLMTDVCACRQTIIVVRLLLRLKNIMQFNQTYYTVPVLDLAYLSSLLESYLIGQYDLILYSSFCYAWIIFFSILSSFISKPCVNHISWWLDTQNFGYFGVRLSNFLWVCEGKYFRFMTHTSLTLKTALF